MSLRERIDRANQEAMEILLGSRPKWIDVKPAIEVVPGMKKNLILHAGPPISWDRMCSAQRKGVAGAAVFEGLAPTLEEAKALGERGGIEIGPCHEHATVGSMAGITSASMPVLVVVNEPYGNRAYINVHEGPARNRLTYGAFDEEVRRNLEWIRDVLGPVLAHAIDELGQLDIVSMIGRALTMGDECHNKSPAGTALFALQALPTIIESDFAREEVANVARFLAETDHFFLHLAMAAGKASTDAMSSVRCSSIVTAIARNGVEVGIRLSGTGNSWFTGPAATIDGVYFSGYGPKDAEADMGDSAITETVGLGAFAMAASISMAYAVGGTAEDAVRYSESMVDITEARHPVFKVPILDYQGTPVGIDARKVVQTNVMPIIDTAIAHKDGGEIGVGIARPPMECFTQALRALKEECEQNT